MPLEVVWPKMKESKLAFSWERDYDGHTPVANAHLTGTVTRVGESNRDTCEVQIRLTGEEEAHCCDISFKVTGNMEIGIIADALEVAVLLMQDEPAQARWKLSRRYQELKDFNRKAETK